MNKNDLIQKYFQKADQLTITNQAYQKLVYDLFFWLLKNDKVDKDITSKLLLEDKQIVNAHIIAKQQLTIAGLEEIEYLLKRFTDIKADFLLKDGDLAKEKQTIIKLTGSAGKILSFERVILNILQRLSGIATATRNLSEKIKNEKPFIAATRKTQWGLLDKKAVAVGEGLTHRLDLSDGVLVKDNHLMLMSAPVALIKLLKNLNKTLIEVEVENKKDLLELIDIFSKENSDNVLAILLDNFSPNEAKEIIKKVDIHSNIIFEASGGITSENIDNWTESGVDIISLGALTHSTKSVDISLDLV